MSILTEIKNIDSSKKELRKFGLTVGIILVLIAGWMWHKHRPAYPIVGGIGLFLIVAGLIIPIILKPLHKVWMGFAVIMGYIMSRVIVTLLFIIIITPLSVIMRMVNKKFLALKPDKKQSSYWLIREEKFDPKTFEDQF
jgi:hypothetical protein